MPSRSKSYPSLLALLALFAIASTGFADGFIIIPNPPPHPIVIHPPHHHPPRPRPWPRPHPPRVYQFAPMQVTFHHVNVTIKDQVAITEVDQEFYNPNNARLEGHYVFPLPKGAEIDKFSMDINGKQQQAELLDAKKARQIYTDIVRKMKDPALMEYADRGMFKVRIYPIEPHSKKRVKIRYTQVLTADNELVGYNYPLNTEKFSSVPIKEVSIKCTLDTQQPIKTVYSPSHKVEVKRKGKKQAVIGWEVKNAKPDTDFQIYFSTKPKNGEDIAVNLVAYNNGHKDGGHFMMFISPGDLADQQIVKKDVLFVLDTSGSMSGDKMKQAKKALKFCVDNLNKGDRFEIIRFSTEAEALFDGLMKADDANRSKANDFVDDLKAIGGTAIEEALLMAVKTINAKKKDGRPAMVIFLTDGRPTIGNTDESAIVASVQKAVGKEAVRVFCFGIGTDINTHLLDKITDHTRAKSQYVLPEEDIEVKVSNFFTKISHPVLANIDLKIKGDVRVSKMYPHAMPDIFRGDQLIVLGQYKGTTAAGAKSTDVAVQLTGFVDGEKRTMTYEIGFPTKAKQNTFIPRLWAVRRVGYLLQQVRLHGESSELRDEVTRLARRYGIVTPYTSYLILEDEAKREHAPRLTNAAPDAPASTPAKLALRQNAAGNSPTDNFRYRDGQALRAGRKEKSGESAVAGSKADDALKDADSFDSGVNEASRTESKALAKRGAFGNAPGGQSNGKNPQKPRSATLHTSKFVGGRTFYFNGVAWVDSLVQELSKDHAKPKTIKFGSDEYFDLMTKHEDASKWFAVGTHVIVVVEGQAYEVIANPDQK